VTTFGWQPRGSCERWKSGFWKDNNSAAVDLFDVDHAKKVLAAFGRAFGKLPENTQTKEQNEFLNQSVQGLAQESKIICVRLALFAEMMKGKQWTRGTLKEVGGTEGVGMAFLEETFSAATAPPEHRYHQKAARAVLKALLPESGADIKGHMRSHAELLGASGYGNRPKDFDDLIRILDNEIRLITPSDPEGQETEGASPSQVPPGHKYYQLTHDYLVHSLRHWLTRKQKETRRGRAELLLADLASVWSARPENRQLPSLVQWLQVRWHTRKQNCTPPQQKMIRKATQYHAVRGLAVVILLALLAWGGYEVHGQLQAHALRARLLDANTNEVPAIVQDMAPYRRWIDRLLRDSYYEAKANKDTRKQLHTSLALLPVESTQVDYIYNRLLDAAPHEVPVLRDALTPHRAELLDKLWTTVEKPAYGQEQQRLRAACALTSFDPDSRRWAKVQEQIANDLVSVPPVYLERWMDALRPLRAKLLDSLSAIHRDGDAQREPMERTLATNILADYAMHQPQVLADLLMDSDEKQFAVLYPRLRDHGLASLLREVEKHLPPDAGEDAKEKLAKRQANAGVALLKMDRSEKVWPLLKHNPDPRVRSYLIHRLGPMGADPKTVVNRLEEEPDVTIRRALVLSLGEFGEKEFPTGERAMVLEKLREVYRHDPDPGLRGAAEWLLRRWKQDRWLKQREEEWAEDNKGKERRLERIRQELAREKGAAKPHWYVSGQGQTMVILPGPAEFWMGSPSTEANRQPQEHLHLRRIGRTFAIAAKPVTVEQFLRFREDHSYVPPLAPTIDCPVHWTMWYGAAEYCNWLSEREGIGKDQWCYEPNTQGQYSQGMKLKPHYLSLSGYRLPTAAEMEYACRAGALTSRYFGESEELLGKYGWYVGNSGGRSWPVGSLKPNDFGLFDMHGNLWCWCQERQKFHAQDQGGGPVDDDEDVLEVTDEEARLTRGGSCTNPAGLVRSASRLWVVPPTRGTYVGFRPARTFR
jgi:formylglycine-generating enzyme required for sulfatase activity